MDSNNSAIQVFNYNSRQVRTIDRDGEVWFVGKDVCDILKLGNITEALRGLDNDELTSVLLKSGGQNREMTAINEPGLYRLIFKSRKTEAKKFQRWLAHEVLPAIRKTGAYAVSGDMQKQLHKLEAENILLHEKVDAMLEQLAESGLLSFRSHFDYP